MVIDSNRVNIFHVLRFVIKKQSVRLIGVVENAHNKKDFPGQLVNSLL